MAEPFPPDLARVVEAIEIHSPTSFALAGRPPVRIHPQAGTMPPLPGAFPHPLPPNPLVRELQARLYQHCYAHVFDPAQFERDVQAATSGATATPNPDFTKALSRANRSRERWDGFWQVFQLGPHGQVHVQKGDRCRTAMPSDIAPGQAPPQVGATISLRVARESFELQPGYYFVLGETLSDSFDDFSIIRFYFHITDRGVEKLIELVTTELNAFEVPFRFKTPTYPLLYDRTDAAVLYVSRRYFSVVARLLARHGDELEAGLRPEVPLFSKRFARGIGLAEDPGNGESFGMSRCRLTAEGLVDAFMQERRATPDRLKAVAQRFALSGLALDRPYLNAGSADTYDVDAITSPGS